MKFLVGDLNSDEQKSTPSHPNDLVKVEFKYCSLSEFTCNALDFGKLQPIYLCVTTLHQMEKAGSDAAELLSAAFTTVSQAI